ncbi:MAG TPA: alpha/beta hydrolase fold domain-containing protein, partial [Xanthomonadales bacterium]|nr:alpha/beta hydrolase fold domain-containing protein [Xanthomonadales bacterium]
STMALEAADDVGGTWYWNRYPGARCDIESIDYSYSFDPGLETEWTWSERYATQPEILRYLQHVAEKHDLRRDIRFSTGVEAAAWDDRKAWWAVKTSGGDEVTCRYYVMATGCLSKPKVPDIDGHDRFLGDVYFTSGWPHQGVDFTGQRVAVIGTGSSGVQSIPLIARQAAELTVFQRTPSYCIPARNGPVPAERLARFEKDRAAYREAARWTRAGALEDIPAVGALGVSEEERLARYEEVWATGNLLAISGAFADIVTNAESNETLCEFVRGKIRAIVRDPDTAEALCPKDVHIATKRPCLDTDYYETYNLPHVRLVDLRQDPIDTITETGIETANGRFSFDAIVFATGFDAMTGALVSVDITGRDGLTLRQKWSHGPATYLGLMTTGFPNFFTVTGPGSPSVLSNMAVSIEQHVEWISATLLALRGRGTELIEPTPMAEAGWVQHVNDCGDITLLPQADSWYTGANVPGKPRVFLPYIGGVGTYRQICNEVAERDYLGFRLEGPAGSSCNDGVIRRLQPDTAMVLDMIATLQWPRIETLPVADARAFAIETLSGRPPGPEVGDVADGTCPGAAGPLGYRLYRPDSPGPHPLVVYFHGGGWVLGGYDTDDPLCRDLCVRSNALILSVDYRHAPEARFPAAADDAFAAIQWAAANAAALGGIPGQLAVGGWSAGGNLAAVVCQMARDAGGPALAGQLLITPVTDCDFSTASYRSNGEGYFLTRDLMRWFWDHYADPAERLSPRASPLRAASLAGLPPAFVVTCEFDPLRDEGVAYAEALQAAGVPTGQLQCRGQIHTSLSLVDVVLSGAGARGSMGAALRGFFAAA